MFSQFLMMTEYDILHKSFYGMGLKWGGREENTHELMGVFYKQNGLKWKVDYRGNRV